MKTCNHPSIVSHNYDHPEPTVNRMCLSCGAHWFGPVGSEREFSRAEWDAWVNTVEA